MPRDQIQSEMNTAWRTYLDALEKSMDLLENDMAEAKEMAGVCTSEWCEATEHTIDELNNALFSISEPHWLDPEASQKIKLLERRIYDLYFNYKGVSEKCD